MEKQAVHSASVYRDSVYDFSQASDCGYSIQMPVYSKGSKSTMDMLDNNISELEIIIMPQYVIASYWPFSPYVLSFPVSDCSLSGCQRVSNVEEEDSLMTVEASPTMVHFLYLLSAQEASQY